MKIIKMHKGDKILIKSLEQSMVLEVLDAYGNKEILVYRQPLDSEVQER